MEEGDTNAKLKGGAADPVKIQAIKQLAPHTSVKELRSVLGLCRDHRRLIKKYADIAALPTPFCEQAQQELHRQQEEYRQWKVERDRQEGRPPFTHQQWSDFNAAQLKARKQQRHNVDDDEHSTKRLPVKWQWTSQHQHAFDTLKNCLMTAPVLAHRDYSAPFYLHTDASGHAVGAVLAQFQDERERVIGYFSATLSDAERRYSATEREAYAILLATKHFRPYLTSTQVTVVSDHASL
eukprot:51760-Eustigmatos_ZCMA.PRE.1